MVGNSLNSYEFSVDKKVSGAFRFFRAAYKFAVVLASFSVTLLIIALMSEKAKSEMLMFLFVSQFFFLFLALFAVYFTNGLFYVSYEYASEKGTLNITEVKGKHVFGKIYTKTLVDTRIGAAKRIGKLAPGEDPGPYVLSALSGKDVGERWFITFERDGKDVTAVFECDPKLRAILTFYGDSVINRE